MHVPSLSLILSHVRPFFPPVGSSHPSYVRRKRKKKNRSVDGRGGRARRRVFLSEIRPPPFLSRILEGRRRETKGRIHGSWFERSPGSIGRPLNRNGNPAEGGDWKGKRSDRENTFRWTRRPSRESTVEHEVERGDPKLRLSLSPGRRGWGIVGRDLDKNQERSYLRRLHVRTRARRTDPSTRAHLVHAHERSFSKPFAFFRTGSRSLVERRTLVRETKGRVTRTDPSHLRKRLSWHRDRRNEAHVRW